MQNTINNFSYIPERKTLFHNAAFVFQLEVVQYLETSIGRCCEVLKNYLKDESSWNVKFVEFKDREISTLEKNECKIFHSGRCKSLDEFEKEQIELLNNRHPEDIKVVTVERLKDLVDFYDKIFFSILYDVTSMDQSGYMYLVMQKKPQEPYDEKDPFELLKNEKYSDKQDIQFNIDDNNLKNKFVKQYEGHKNHLHKFVEVLKLKKELRLKLEWLKRSIVEYGGKVPELGENWDQMCKTKDQVARHNIGIMSFFQQLQTGQGISFINFKKEEGN